MRALATLVAAAAIGLFAVGCGSSSDSSSKSSSSNGSASAETVTWKVGADPTFRPFAFYDKSKTLVGFDVDLSQALADHMKMKLDLQPTAWDGIIPALDAKKIDAVPDMSITEERKQQVLFTNPVIEQGITTVVKADRTDFNPGPDNLDGVKVGVQVNTAAASTVHKIKGAKVTEYNTAEDAYNDLMLGRVDAVAIESTNAGYSVEHIYPGKLRVTNQELATEKVGVAAALRKDDTAMQGKINTALDAMRQDGTLDKVVKKWFGDIKY
jgi:ABC-type amino acid transport substrate-binding protein